MNDIVRMNVLDNHEEGQISDDIKSVRPTYLLGGAVFSGLITGGSSPSSTGAGGGFAASRSANQARSPPSTAGAAEAKGAELSSMIDEGITGTAFSLPSSFVSGEDVVTRSSSASRSS